MKPRKLNDEQVRQVQELWRSGVKGVVIAKQFGISSQLVSQIVHYGYDRPKKTEEPIMDRPSSFESRKCWSAIADEYSRKYPNDPITSEQAKRTHDAVIARLRYHMRNSQEFAFLGEPNEDLL